VPVRRHLHRRVPEPAAVSWATFHTLRHTCASLLFADGRKAVQVQRWLGHHLAAFTLSTYVHLMDVDIGKPLTMAAGLAPHGPGEPQRHPPLPRAQ